MHSFAIRINKREVKSSFSQGSPCLSQVASIVKVIGKPKDETTK